MRVDWVILCRYCEIGEGGATIVGGGIDAMTVPVVPAPVQVMVAVRLVGQEGEVQGTMQHRITANVLNPAMEQITPPFEATFTAQRGPQHPPGWEASAIIPMMHRFLAETEGAYTINIAVDGKSQTVTFVVHVGSQPTSTTPGEAT
jgi:hypothetical protein